MNQIATTVTLTSLRESGLDFDDVARLLWLKHQVETGKRSEITPEHKQRMFLQYLYQHGLIDG